MIDMNLYNYQPAEMLKYLSLLVVTPLSICFEANKGSIFHIPESQAVQPNSNIYNFAKDFILIVFFSLNLEVLHYFNIIIIKFDHEVGKSQQIHKTIFINTIKCGLKFVWCRENLQYEVMAKYTPIPEKFVFVKNNLFRDFSVEVFGSIINIPAGY